MSDFIFDPPLKNQWTLPILEGKNGYARLLRDFKSYFWLYVILYMMRLHCILLKYC